MIGFMKRFRALILVLFFAAKLCGYDQDVTLQLKWKHQFQFAGYYAALEKGFYKEAGLNVKIDEWDNKINPIERVLSGSAEYGVGNSDLLLFRHKGYQPVLLAVFLQHSPLAIMVHENSDIKTVNDFVGKKLLFEPNSNELKGWLQRADLSEKNVTIIYESHKLTRFINREVDALSVYTTKEPFQMQKLGLHYRIFKPIDLGIDFYGDNLFTSEREIRANPQRAKAFRDASIKGWKYAMAHKEEIAKLIYERYSKYVSVGELIEEANEIEKYMESSIIEPGYYKEGRWRHIADTYLELGMLPKAVSFDGFFYESYISKYPEWVVSGMYTVGVAFVVLLTVLVIFYAQQRALRASEKKYKTLYEKAPFGFVLLDKGLMITEWNKAAKEMFGYDRGDTLGKNILELLVASDVAGELRPKFAQLLSEGIEFSSINQNIKKNKETITCEWVNTVFYNARGEIDGIVCMATDVTTREDTLQKTIESEKRFKTMLDSAPFPIVITDYTTSEILFVNQAAATEMGETKTNLLGKPAIEYWSDLFDREVYIKELKKRGYLDNFEVMFKRKNGTHFWAQMSANRMVCDHKDAAFISFLNIDTQKKAREELKARSVAIEYAANGFMITDIDGKIEYTNPAFTEITGFTTDEARGQTPRILKSGVHPSSFYEKLWGSILEGKIWRGVVLNKTKSGNTYYQSTAIAPVRNDFGKIIKFISILQDISEQKELEQRLERLAHYDQLTTLANRTLFFEYLDEKIAEASEIKPLALLFIDLDGFKEVNDRLGHESGDIVLRGVSARIRDCVEDTGFVARMGGDEFTVTLCENIDMDRLKKCAECIIEAVNKEYLDILTAGELGASIGIAIYPHFAKDAKALLAKADEAMYKAKTNGKNRYFIYAEGI